MSPPVHTPAPEALLAQRDFVRTLVRSLLRGADGEDDVVQQAWLRALRQAPRDEVRWRPWLARVCRNLAFDHLRDARRRERRERNAATAEAVPSTTDVLQREEERQRVVHAVLGLPQPYRTTVLLRYWEELTPAAIAERLGVPGATVRSQLKRGLAMLRERLDQDYGRRRSWVLALAPFAGLQGAGLEGSGLDVASPIAGAMVMSTKAKSVLAVCGLLVAGLLTWWSLRPDASSPPGPSPEPAPAVMSTDLPEHRETHGAALEDAAQPAKREAVAAADATLRVHGRVLWSGSPYPGLRLVLRWFDGYDARGKPSSEHDLVSDANGRFEWRGPVREVAGTVQATGSSVTARVFCSPVVVFADQRSVELAVSVIPLDCVLRGRVMSLTGDPIAGALIDVNGWNETESEADGRFEMNIPRGEDSMPLVARAAGHAQRWIQTNIPADATSYEIEIVLEPGVGFAGRVIDEAGAPIAAAKIAASGLFHTVTTDGDGRFSIEGAAPGSSHEISAHKRGFRRGHVVRDAGDQKIEIVLKPGTALDLHVVDPAGRGVAGARIRVITEPGRGWQPRGFTRDDGRFRLEDLEHGSLVVLADKSGFARAWHEVEIGDDPTGLVIRLERGYAVRGRVVDAAGQPLGGASVYARIARDDGEDHSVGTRVDSDVDGKFEITDLPRAPCTVFAFRRGYVRASAEDVVAGNPDLVLRLERAPSVAGRVLDGASGEPIDEFTVRVESDPPSVWLDPLVFKDTDGYWQAQNSRMKGGIDLDVDVSAPGYAPSRATTTAIVDPPADQTVMLLYPGITVHGTVRHAVTGEPIPGATVELQTEGGASRRLLLPRDDAVRTLTDEVGRFSIPSVPPGETRLALTHPTFPRTTFGPFEVHSGAGELEVHPTMTPGVAIRGRAVGFEGAVGWRVTAQRRTEMRARRTEIRPDFTFELEGLGPGTYAVTLRDPSNHSRSRYVDVGESDVEGVELTAREGPGSILVELRGLERGWAQVEAVSEAPQSHHPARHLLPFETNPFTVAGLAAGNYRITIFSPNTPSETTAEVAVGAGEVPVVIDVGKD